jgi:hypothetical protein
MVARYLVLKTEPDEAIGKPYSTFAAYLTPEKVVAEMVQRRLRSCEDEALRFLSAELRPTLLRVATTQLPQPAANTE